MFGIRSFFSEQYLFYDYRKTAVGRILFQCAFFSRFHYLGKDPKLPNLCSDYITWKE